MKKNQLVSLISISFLFLMTGCTATLGLRTPLSLERVKECQAFLTALDNEVEKADVRDAANHPVPGFPYLRTNRFLSGLKKNIHSGEGREQWARWMQALDLESRRKEISNLPDAVFTSFSVKAGTRSSRGQFYEQAGSCSEMLFQHDRTRPDFYKTLLPSVSVPDEYSLAMRIFGLYPIVAAPVALATEISRKKILAWFDTALENLPVDGRLRAYVPAVSPFPDDDIEGMINASRENVLCVPVPDPDLKKKLVQRFAPVFIQDVADSYDRIGRIVWRGDCPDVDTTRPTVYYYFSNILLKGRPVLQINYVIWYSARAGKRAPWIEQGHLDGLTLRISLDELGKPFMADIINDCGCYHFFSPEKARVPEIISKPLKFDPFVPQWLPDLSPGSRIGVRVNSGWHQVQRLIAAEDFPESISYELVPYDILEELPRQEGQTESIFSPKGTVKCSKRIERFLFFSMGIPEIGSMRQRGHHAIELIGRAHFDDPELFDESFIFK